MHHYEMNTYPLESLTFINKFSDYIPLRLYQIGLSTLINGNMPDAIL